MNSKLQKLNEKILFVSKFLEQNKNDIANNTSLEEEKNEINIHNSNLNIPKNNCFKTTVNIDKNILLKGKIDSLEDDYNLKISKLNSKYDELTNELNKISDYLNTVYESENSYNLNFINELNNIKNNLDYIYDEQNKKIEQEINYYTKNIINNIQSIENYNINESLQDKNNILGLEQFCNNLISEIYNKMNSYNIYSDNDKKEKSQEICKGLVNEDEQINNIKINSDALLMELKDKFNNSINEMMNNFINIEETKRENFRNNIMEILSETLNNILSNRGKK